MFSGRESITSSISQDIFNIDLDGIPCNERVIIERLTDTTDTTYTTFTVQFLCPFSGSWLTLYTWTVKGLVHTEIENEIWNILNAPAAILKIFDETGTILSYRVIAYQSGILTSLISRDGIFQGDVFFDGFNIIERSGTQYRTWMISDGKLVLSR